MLEQVGDFFWRKKKSMGAGISGGGTWGPRGRGVPCEGGCAMDPRGQVLAPLVVFSVPYILKYSRKKSYLILGHLENFYFRGIFYCTDNSENRQKILFLLYLI